MPLYDSPRHFEHLVVKNIRLPTNAGIFSPQSGQRAQAAWSIGENEAGNLGRVTFNSGGSAMGTHQHDIDETAEISG